MKQMSDAAPPGKVETSKSASERLAERRRSFQDHLQQIRAELAQTNAEIAAQLNRSKAESAAKPAQMYAEIRRYSGEGVAALFDLIEECKGEIESLMRSIPGFVSYSLFRTEGGGVAFTVCQHKKGTDQSARVAHDWIASNAAELSTDDPEITQGRIVVHLS